MKIKNKSWSQLVITVSEGKSITIPARGSVDMNEKDFQSTECQRLFKNRNIIVLPSKKAGKSGAGKESKSGAGGQSEQPE